MPDAADRTSAAPAVPAASAHAPTGRTPAWTAGWRVLRAVGHAVRGLWLIRRRFPGWTPAEQGACIERWSREMLAILGIALRVDGAPARGPVLLVANHVSWLDILVLHAVRNCRFVAKSEIRGWPLVGTLATGAGTLYIERASRRDALRVVHTMAERLAAGEILGVFPEGAIGDGRAVQPFHANVLQAAISSDAPIQPLALRYLDTASGAHSDAPYYGRGVSLPRSLWRTVRARPLTARVVCGPAEPARGRDRRTWAQDLQGRVAAQWQAALSAAPTTGPPAG
jgi:1-acyl-sn-glycerol-3-phosphate acyltransferase